MRLTGRASSAVFGLLGAAPAVGVALALTMAPADPLPSRASASEREDEAAEVVRSPALTAAQRESVAHAQDVIGAPLERTPLYYPFERKVEAGDRGEAVSDEDPVRGAPPDLVVTSVVRGERSVFAIVNGNAKRVGDEIEPGWELVSIDPLRASVTIRSVDGREVVGVVGRRER